MFPVSMSSMLERPLLRSEASPSATLHIAGTKLEQDFNNEPISTLHLSDLPGRWGSFRGFQLSSSPGSDSSEQCLLNQYHLTMTKTATCFKTMNLKYRILLSLSDFIFSDNLLPSSIKLAPKCDSSYHIT